MKDWRWYDRLAFWVVMAIPGAWLRSNHWLLPYAGRYAHSDYHIPNDSPLKRFLTK